MYAGERFRAAVSVSCNVEAGRAANGSEGPHSTQRAAALCSAAGSVRVELTVLSQHGRSHSSVVVRCVVCCVCVVLCVLVVAVGAAECFSPLEFAGVCVVSSAGSSPVVPSPPSRPDGHASYVVSDVSCGARPALPHLLHQPTADSTSAVGPPLLTYQKFFKFNVQSALSIASVVHARDDWLLAELAVTNSTSRPLRISDVSIDTRSEQEVHAEGSNTSDDTIGSSGSTTSTSSTHFLVHSILSSPTAAGPSSQSPSAASSSGLLAPSATRTYLFRIDQLSVDSRRVVDIGRVSVEWRQHMGELCRLQAACAVHRTARTTSTQMAATAQPTSSSSSGGTSQPPVTPSATAPSAAFPPLPPAPSAARPSDVSVQLVSCPATAVLERPFAVRLLVNNPLPVALHRCQLLMMRDKMGSVLPVGRSRLLVGEEGAEQQQQQHHQHTGGTLQPHSSHTVDITLAGIGLGIHKIGGIRVIAHTAAAASPPIQLDFDALQHIEIVTQD